MHEAKLLATIGFNAEASRKNDIPINCWCILSISCRSQVRQQREDNANSQREVSHNHGPCFQFLRAWSTTMQCTHLITFHNSRHHNYNLLMHVLQFMLMIIILSIVLFNSYTYWKNVALPQELVRVFFEDDILRDLQPLRTTVPRRLLDCHTMMRSMAR